MRKIHVRAAQTTGLDPVFAHVQSIEVEDQALGEGGFGEVYRVLSINGRKAPPQVVKLLFENGQGLARRGLETVQELQRRLEAKNMESIRVTGKPLLERFPALYGVPQLSFEGTLNHRTILGYSANDLSAAGMEDFGRILEDDAKISRYQALPLSMKIQIAAQLASAFEFLSTHLLFIHADIKAEALFLDTQRGRCAIIDYDSGALARDPNDRPTTFGTMQDWLAPEIGRQLSASAKRTRAVKVNLLSDIWSVNVAIHYLLFGFHPYFFLTEMSERAMRAYFRAHRWPDVKENFPYFRRDLRQAYSRYVHFLRTKLPREVLDRFQATFNEGYGEPGRRTTYGQWKAVLNAVNRPAIRRFEADRTMVEDSRPVRLSWEVTGAARLELAPVGDVTGRTCLDVTIRRDTEFTLILFAQDGSRLERSLSVKVSTEPPCIHYFLADRNVLKDSRPVRLSWKVTDAAKVELEGVGDVTGMSSVEIAAPRVDTTLTLIAASLFGVTARAQLRLNVWKEPPRIELFEADRTFLDDARPLELRWRVSGNPQQVIISGVGQVPAQGSVQLRPTRDQTYMLQAVSYFGCSAQREITVRVSKDPPRIGFFRAEPALVWQGQPVVISWKVENAARVEIEPGIGRVPSEGRVQVRPSMDTRFVLTAESYFGVQTKAEAVVLVVRPTKVDFRVTPLVKPTALEAVGRLLKP